MGIIIAPIIAAIGLLAATLGYAGYWLAGGGVDAQAWQALAAMWGAVAPFLAISILCLWMDAA